MFKKARVKRAGVSIPKRKWKTGRLNHKEWDSTVSDMTAHKASEEEIQRRRLIHKSKNASAARRALGERAKMVFMDPASPGQVELEMKKLAILKEVLYDHDDLNEVLKRVDTTMSSVKTIFHGAPYRKSGNPNVTLAPGSKSTTASGPVPVREEPTTQMSLLSDSVMDKHALNEETASSEDEDPDEEKFESKVDYERFLNVLRESLNKSIVPPQPGPAGDATMTPVNNGKLGTQQQALNCTEEVKRTMARIRNQNDDEQEEVPPAQTRTIDDTITKLTTGKKAGDKKKNQSVSFSLADDSSGLPPPRANVTANNMTYENLQEAMESVSNNLNEMECRRGKNAPPIANLSIKSDGLAGFTATLIDAVTRLTVYVNEAEGKLLATESRMEELKNQNDHQRALLDALTVELMSTQDQIRTLKDALAKQNENHVKDQEDLKKSILEEVKLLRDRISDLENGKKRDITGPGPASATGDQAKEFDIEIPDDFHILESGTTADDKKKREEALKSDMLCLLTALKSQDKESSQKGTAQQEQIEILPMNNATTKGAAQTVASVESQLRHLQLQHAEAQNRLQELTEVAGFLAGKVAESQSQSSSTSSRSEPMTPSTNDSSATPSIVSGPITPHEVDEEFRPMIPNNANESDDSISGITITSSMFANIGGDTSRPSVQSSAFSQNLASPSTDRRVAEDISSLKSSDRVNISEDSFHELAGKNVPSLLQSNIYGLPVTSDVLRMFNPTPAAGQDRQPPTLPPFKPTGLLNTDPGNLTNSIQQTQFNLEDRIAELNRQHAEAQTRLKKLIRKRTDIHSPSSLSSHSGTSSSMRVIQVTLPTDDMLKTPQIHKAPEPFKPMALEEHSFL